MIRSRLQLHLWMGETNMLNQIEFAEGKKLG